MLRVAAPDSASTDAKLKRYVSVCRRGSPGHHARVQENTSRSRYSVAGWAIPLNAFRSVHARLFFRVIPRRRHIDHSLSGVLKRIRRRAGDRDRHGDNGHGKTRRLPP